MRALVDARDHAAVEVTGGRGAWVSAFVDERAAQDVHVVVHVLEELRGALPDGDARLRVEWVQLPGRDVLLFAMGVPE